MILRSYFFGASGLLLSVHLPWTKNNEPRSAFSSMETFCNILWHKDRTSSSLQISLTWMNESIEWMSGRITEWCDKLVARVQHTNSNINCFSSKCFSSWRDNRCGRCGWLDIEFIGHDPDPETISFCELILKNVGVPSIVFTMGLSKPPRSNSCAEIFLWMNKSEAKPQNPHRRVIHTRTKKGTYKIKEEERKGRDKSN